MIPVVAIVQARMGSTRLPGKVLLPLGQMPVLGHVVSRLGRAGSLDRVVVAIPEGPTDMTLRIYCRQIKIPFVPGPEQDVLARYVLAARESRADHVVRVTADCPCVDPDLVDLVVSRHLETEADYTSNTIERTFPRGFDVEVFKTSCLLKAERETQLAHHREHVTPYFYQNPDKFRLTSVTAPSWFGEPSWRICLDTLDDYQALSSLWSLTHDSAGEFPGALQLSKNLERHTEVIRMNANVRQKELPGAQAQIPGVG